MSVHKNPNKDPGRAPQKVGGRNQQRRRSIIPDFLRRSSKPVPPGDLESQVSLKAVKQLHADLSQKENIVKLYRLFNLWDEDGDGTISVQELRRALKMMRIPSKDADIKAFFDLIDENKSGSLSFSEMVQALDSPKIFEALETGEADAPQPDNQKSKSMRGSSRALAHHLGDMLGMGLEESAPRGTLQSLKVGTVDGWSLLYVLANLVFVTISLSLVTAIRVKNEYLLEKRVEDTFLSNTFDSALNTFRDVRRKTDVYEWGNKVLWPGLFGDGGPNCGSVVGAPGFFNSAVGTPAWEPISAARLATVKGGCVDDGWSDAADEFGAADELREYGRQTPFSVAEQVDRMHQLDWSKGIAIRQVRVAMVADESCETYTWSGPCRPERGANDRTAFGFNWTEPSAALDSPFVFWTHEEAGLNPNGQKSTNFASRRSFESGGPMSVILPFFAHTWLPEQRGKCTKPGVPASLASAATDTCDVIDYRQYQADGTTGLTPKYFCVRRSWNGVHLHQICDPNSDVVAPDGTNRTTGIVRAAVEEFWNDLKRAHYLDAATRVSPHFEPLPLWVPAEGGLGQSSSTLVTHVSSALRAVQARWRSCYISPRGIWECVSASRSSLRGRRQVHT